ncbi:MAG: class I SAM-dependent methyltransferase [Methanogenium sp.]|jgi:SAM-dependent methyltransferase
MNVISELKEKYSNAKCLKTINDFLQKDLTYQDVDDLEKIIDEEWKTNYKNFDKYYSYEYIYIALNCFKKYSKNSVFKTFEYLGSDKIEKILDLGAGIGLTTNLLQDLFPNSKVYYLNLEKSLQNDFFEKIKNPKIEIINNEEDLYNNKFDIIFASELFEHIEKPIELLKKTMKICDKYFVTSNAFGPEAYGHFTSYSVDDIVFAPRETSKKFLKTIREEFEEMKIKTWNSRPRIFKRIEDTKQLKLF